MDGKRKIPLLLAALLFLLMLGANVVGGQNGTPDLYLPLMMKPRSVYWSIALDSSESEAGEVYAVNETGDGYIVLAGRVRQALDSGYYNYWLAKVTNRGEPVWERSYDAGLDRDDFHTAQPTADGGFILSGLGFFASDTYAWLVRVDAAGNIIWQKGYGGEDWLDYAAETVQTSDGGFIMAGYTAAFGVGISDLLVLKLNSDGSIAWQKTVHYGVFDAGRAVVQTSDGGYLIAGADTNNGEYWVVKLDPAGNLQWFKVYPGVTINDLSLLSGDGFVLAGRVGEDTAADLWVAQANSAGDLEWQIRYGGPAADAAAAIEPLPEGGFIVAGETDSFGNDLGNGFLLKLSPAGSIIWQKTYGVDHDERFTTVTLTSDGGYALGGITSGTVSWPFWALKVDALGDIPFCDFIGDGQAVATPTQVAPVGAMPTILDAGIIPVDTNAVVYDLPMAIETQCPISSTASCNQD